MADRVGLVRDVPAPRAEPDEERAPLAWWQLRSWRIDRSILVRVRDGLHALAPAPPPAAEAPLSRQAAPAPPAGESAPGEPAAGESDPGASEPAEPAQGELPARGPVAETPATGQAAADAAADSGGLTEPAVAAVRSTFAIVAEAEAADKVPGYFYGQLFARDPRLRDLFPPAMNDQRDRLVKALVRIVESLTTPEEMAAYLAQLGRDHRKYRIEPAMYEVVGAALLATLRRFAGPAFTPAAEQAWTDAYAAVSALMIQAADEAGATAPAFWPAEVVDIQERFRGMAVLTIALDQGMRFEAGQHVTVQHPRWPRVWRSYSIAGGARRREELYDLPALWRLADDWPGLQVIPVASDDRAFNGMQGNVGRVAARYLPRRDCEAYVAGPPAMVLESIRLLTQTGLPRSRIHFDDALLAATDVGPPRSG